MPNKLFPSAQLPLSAATGAVPECIRQFGQIVAATALAVFITAFVTIPYALERQPGDLAKVEVFDAARHMS